MEQRHVLGASRFELTRVAVPAIRQRVLALLCNVDAGLAQAEADALGRALPAAQPLPLGRPMDGEVKVSPGLPLFARPGGDGVHGRRVALLVAPGTDDADLALLQQTLLDAGVPFHSGRGRRPEPVRFAARKASPVPHGARCKGGGRAAHAARRARDCAQAVFELAGGHAAARVLHCGPRGAIAARVVRYR